MMQPHPRNPGPDPSSLLEALCFYRGLYALRGRDDRESVTSIERAVAEAELRLHAARLRAERAARRNAGYAA
jgi:hypothetical protein